MPRFAAIGLDHRHIYDLTQDLLDAGAECVGYNPDTTDPRVLAGFRKRFPHVPEAETARLLDDPSIDFVVIAARPCDRAELAIAAMQRGKDVMVDKPGITTSEQLAAVERAVRGNRAHLVDLPRPAGLARGAGGAAHRAFGRARAAGAHHVARAAPAEPRAAAGVVLRHAGLWRHHQRYRRALDRSVPRVRRGRRCRRSCRAASARSAPSLTGFEDFAELVLATPSVRGYVRLDWFTPDGLPTWGDGRFFVVGTEGTLELRKNLDIEGREGTDHMFVANRTDHALRRLQQAAGDLLSDFLRDIAERTRDRDAAAAGVQCLPARVAGAGTGAALRGEAAMIGVSVIGLGNALQPHARALVDLADRVRVVWAAASSADAIAGRRRPLRISHHHRCPARHRGSGGRCGGGADAGQRASADRATRRSPPASMCCARSRWRCRSSAASS